MSKLLRSSMLVLAFACTGCATFESGALPGLERWPEVAAVAAPAKPSEVSLELSGLPEKFVNGWRQGAAAVLADCGRKPVAAAADADRQVSFAFVHSRQNLWLTRIWMGLCGVTGGIVPARTVQYFELEATIRDAAGNELGKVTRSVDGQTWVGWLPLLALPFAGGGLGELVRDTTRSVVVEAFDNGWL